MLSILATAESATGGIGNLGIIAYIVLLGGMFYFLLIRPQRKQRREKAEMMNTLTVGTEVFTIGGILGTITRIKERTVWLQVAEKTEIEVLKSSIGGLSQKGEE